MSALRRLLLVTALGLNLSLAGQVSAEPIIKNVSTFMLGNGMQVVVIPDHRAPVVTHMVYYKAGSADEPMGEAGIAHFLEHLMFKGTPRYPAGELDRVIRINGGEGNAFTTRDYTGYYQRIARDQLDLMMDLEADRMQNLVLKDENVLPERDVILEERRERIDNDPSSLLGEQLDSVLYHAHPYQKPVIGWMEEMKQLDREDAIDFYRTFYTPANAVLVVAGDVTAEEVKALAEKRYGVLKNTFTPKPRLRTPEPEPIAARRVILKDNRAASPMLQRAYVAPSYATDSDGEAEALEILAEIMGGGTTSRLYRKLVVDDRVAAYSGAWYSGDGLDSGSFSVYGAPAPAVDIARVETGIDAVIEDIITNGVTPEELARAKNRLIAASVYSLDSQSALARSFGTALTTGQTVEDVLEWPQRIEAVTAEQVKAAAARVLDERRSVTGLLLPGDNPSGAAAPNPAALDSATQH
ncbi:MAG: insulinase family protein [Rhizobiales bacterium]|nr:insulinase family protein [Hyphomicrobiales bacterium]